MRFTVPKCLQPLVLGSHRAARASPWPARSSPAPVAPPAEPAPCLRVGSCPVPRGTGISARGLFGLASPRQQGVLRSVALQRVSTHVHTCPRLSAVPWRGCAVRPLAECPAACPASCVAECTWANLTRCSCPLHSRPLTVSLCRPLSLTTPSSSTRAPSFSKSCPTSWCTRKS